MMYRLSLGVSLLMILSLARMWDFSRRKALVKFVGTYPSALRCYRKCYALRIFGTVVAEGGWGGGARF